MTLVIPEGFAQFEFVHTVSGVSEQAMCTFGAELVDPFDIAQVLAVRDIWQSRIMPFLSDTVTLREVRARVDAGVIGTVSSTTAGGSASAAATPQVCYLVNKATGVPGRAHRGRLYLPGVTEGQVLPSGGIVSTFVTAMNTTLGLLLGDLVTAFSDMHLLHSSEAVTPTPVTSLTLSSLCATQRGRLR